MSDVSKSWLGSPLDFPFSGRQVRNRFCKAAMTERLSSWDPTDREGCGVPSEESIHLFRQWGQSDVGLIITGAIAVDAECMEAPGNPAIGVSVSPPDLRLSRFADMAAAASANGSLVLGQLNHPGRQTPSDMQENPISASDIAMPTNELGLHYNTPRPASHRAIMRVIDQFVHGAKYLSNAGFDGIQINAAHGYLISQFLSPATNRRTDDYGGTLENRARLLLQIVRQIRDGCSDDMVLSVKINCIEYGTTGLQIEDVIKTCSWLQDAGVDMIELSGGTYEEFAWKHASNTDEFREGYFLVAGDKIKPVLTKSRLYATGGFRTKRAMTGAQNTVDGIGLARPLAQDPRICTKILSGEVDEVAPAPFDPNDFRTSAAFAGAQMTRVAHGKRPMDASDPATISNFLEHLRSRSRRPPTSDNSGWLGSDLP